jgi:hypothetical protein
MSAKCRPLPRVLRLKLSYGGTDLEGAMHSATGTALKRHLSSTHTTVSSLLCCCRSVISSPAIVRQIQRR